jgi:hypothetical protein
LAGTTVVRRTPLPESTLILIFVTPDIQQDTGHGVVAVSNQDGKLRFATRFGMNNPKIGYGASDCW